MNKRNEDHLDDSAYVQSIGYITVAHTLLRTMSTSMPESIVLWIFYLSCVFAVFLILTTLCYVFQRTRQKKLWIKRVSHLLTIRPFCILSLLCMFALSCGLETLVGRYIHLAEEFAVGGFFVLVGTIFPLNNDTEGMPTRGNQVGASYRSYQDEKDWEEDTEVGPTTRADD